MAVMKVKNSSGTWTEVDNFTGEIFSNGGRLKSVVVERATPTTFDLSAYVPAGSTDFILFFTWSPTDLNASIGYYYRYILIDGVVAEMPYEDGVSVQHTKYPHEGIDKPVGVDSKDSGLFYECNEVITSQNTSRWEYDTATSTLTMHLYRPDINDKRQLGQKALLYYVG